MDFKLKKIFCILILLYCSFFSFSEDYDRFSFTAKNTDIMDLLKSQGWKYTINSKNNLHRFTPSTGNVKTFRGDQLKEISFQVNDEGTIVSQCFLLDDNYSAASGFYTLMCFCTDDKAQLVNFEIESEKDIVVYTYFAKLQNCNATYTLYSIGNGESVKLMIFYTTLPFED